MSELGSEDFADLYRLLGRLSMDRAYWETNYNHPYGPSWSAVVEAKRIVEAAMRSDGLQHLVEEADRGDAQPPTRTS